jgi:hypothetical protein
MALALDGTPQSSTGSTGGTPTVTYTLTTSHANDIIIVASESNGTIITGVTGPGLTFTRRALNTTQTVEEWSAVASAPLSSAPIVITYASSGSFFSACAFAISGADTSTIWDSNVGLPVTGGTAADPTVSTTNANDIIIGIFRFGSTSDPTPGAGWTTIVAPAGGFFLVQYKIVSAPQSGLTVAVGTGSGDENGYIVDAVVQAGGSPSAAVTFATKKVFFVTDTIVQM